MNDTVEIKSDMGVAKSWAERETNSNFRSNKLLQSVQFFQKAILAFNLKCNLKEKTKTVPTEETKLMYGTAHLLGLPY